MTGFSNPRGLRIKGEIVANGGPAAVAQVDVQINGREPISIHANRISHFSAQNGGSFYGGFEFPVPTKSFRGARCVVVVTETDSALPIAEFTFEKNAYAFEQMLLAMEYGGNVHAGTPIVTLEQNAVLEQTLPGYFEANAESRGKTATIGEATIDWLLHLIDRGNRTAAINLLTRLPLPKLIAADAVKAVQIFLRLAVNGTVEQSQVLFHYVDKFPAIKQGDTHNMIMLCLNYHDSINMPRIDDLKAQLVRWKFSGRAMIVVFEYVELVFGKDELQAFKAWAMKEWIATSKGKETD
jgi:hypothetical protein